MVHLEISNVIRAPLDKVFVLATEYENWPTIFPDMKSVRLVRQAYGEIVLEVNYDSGGIITLIQRAGAPKKIVTDIRRRGVYGQSIYTFEDLPEGTRVTLALNVKLEGLYRLLEPFVQGYIRKRLKTLSLEPLKKAAEASATESTSNLRPKVS